MADPRHEKLAEVLVNYSAAVRKGDVVSIIADPAAFPLVRATFVAALRAGGRPQWTVRSEALTDALYEHATDEQLSLFSPIAMHEIETIDVMIAFITPLNTRSMSRVDPAKFALASAARRLYLHTYMERAASGALRWVLTQCPTHAAAQDAEMSLDQYEDFVFRAGLLHLPDPVAAWRQVKERQERMREWLQGKKEVRFRRPAPDGSMDTGRGATDLTVGVDGATWINCFGDNNFPDGEVFTGPRGVDGVVNYNFPAVENGREVDGVRLEFKAGRVVNASAAKNEEYLLKVLDIDEGARRLGEIAIGTNYAICEHTKNTLFDEKIGGTFHAAIGAGYPRTGNTNESAIHWDMVCDMRPRGGKGGATIEADGEVFQRDGALLKDGWPAPV